MMGVKWLKLLLSIYTCAFVQSLDFLKKSWNLPSNFPDLEKVLKIEIKCKKKMVKRLECFFLKATTSVLQVDFSFFSCWSNLIQSHLYVWSASRKELCSCIIFLSSLLITYFITLILEKRKNCFGKSVEKILNLGS